MIDAAQANREAARNFKHVREDIERVIRLQIEDGSFSARFDPLRWTQDLTVWLENLGYVVEEWDDGERECVEVSWLKQ